MTNQNELILLTAHAVSCMFAATLDPKCYEKYPVLRQLKERLPVEIAKGYEELGMRQSEPQEVSGSQE